MEIELSKNEIETFIELIYLGNWVVNATRLPDRQIVKYAEAVISFLKKADKNYDEDVLHDNVEELIQYYDKNIIFKELAKQYANHHFPYDQRDIVKNKAEFEKQFISNKVLRRLCEKELEDNKLTNVVISLPNLEKEIIIALQKHEN